MRRSPWSRFFSAILALWLALLIAEPLAAMHSCPMHDGAMMMPGGSAMDGMDAREHTSAPATHDHGDTGRRDPVHRGHHCTCIGDCAGTAFWLPATDTAPALAIATAAERDSGLPDYAYIPVAVQHVLPFQVGPPLA